MRNIFDKIKECKYNNFVKQVSRENKGKIFWNRGTKFCLAKTAKLQLKDELHMGYNALIDNGRTTILRLDKDSELIINGKFRVFYGADIICFANSKLILDGGFVNSDVKIRCFEQIHISEGVKIAHDVTIMDGDGHTIEREDYVAHQPIFIGKNVWIGTKSIILKGVTIGEGAIVAAGSVVTRDVPPHSLAAGNPARVIKENISWR